MCEAKEREAWARTSAVMAQIANWAGRCLEDDKMLSAQDFSPFASETKRTSKPLDRTKARDLLKQMKADEEARKKMEAEPK